MKNKLRKIAKKIIKSFRDFKRRNYRKNIKEEDLFSEILSKYEMYYDNNNKNHETNIEIISKVINGIIIMPNEIFSFNENVGERTEEKGFKEGPVYIRGRLEQQLAGGICQAVTGIYNVAILSNLKMIERKAHPKIQNYSGAGLDATVYWGLIDLVFKNTRKYPIKINMCLDKKKGIFTFEIWGRNTDNINIKIKSRKKETKEHIIVEIYREVYNGGRLLKIERISKDKYRKD